MTKRELLAQPASAKCFVCGTDNPYGLGAVFFDDGQEVSVEVTPGEHHQSWPGVLHGGVVSAILDETIGRVAFLHDRWVQTAKLQLRFLRPAPLGVPLRAVGRLVRDQRRLMLMSGELMLRDSGELLAQAEGTFVPLSDAARNELMARLGGDFSAWEEFRARSGRAASLDSSLPLDVPQSRDVETLFARLGGDDGLLAAVSVFYEKITEDAEIAPFFAGIDMESQTRKMTRFMAIAFGQASADEGRSLAVSHAQLVKKGLGDKHFDAVVRLLNESLREIGVDDVTCQEVLGIVGATRDEVLGRSPGVG